MHPIFLGLPRNPVTAVGLPLVAGFLSGSRTKDAVQGKWYNSLKFPPGRPPVGAFPIIWSSFYVAIGFASYIAVQSYDSAVLQSTRDEITTGLGFYYLQLGLNFIWTPLFFGGKQIGLALADSVLLTGTTFYTMKLLDGPTDSRSTYFLFPCCAWLTYATYLNAGIWWCNRDRILAKED